MEAKSLSLMMRAVRALAVPLLPAEHSCHWRIAKFGTISSAFEICAKTILIPLL